MISPPDPTVPLAIRMVGLAAKDLDALARHIVEQNAESGRGGSPRFAVAQAMVREEVRSNLGVRLAKDLDEPLWGRIWALYTPDDRIAGHIELRGGRVPSEMHRALLGMGILRAYTGRGHGARLVETAVAWAREVAKLEWIDLGVFSGNTPARKLYRKMGFVEIGTKEDAFHLEDGARIDDVMMVLRL
jgi:ribosomal protein S18 acetylase RimI-like enzyme